MHLNSLSLSSKHTVPGKSNRFCRAQTIFEAEVVFTICF